MPMHEEQVIVLAPFARAKDAAVQALGQSGVGLRTVEQQGDLVVATITPSLRSFGETMTIKAEPVGPAETRLVVRSASAAALIDWGKNSENVSRVVRSLRGLVHTR